MFQIEREEFIMQQLQLRATVKVAELAEGMEVSLDTVRRDLKSMETSGLVKCVRGGACLPESMEALSHFSGREVIHIELKRRAVIKAIGLIQPGQLIALNSGTTNTVLAQELVKRFSNLTVVTNNLAAATVLMQNPSIHTIVVGGELDPDERSTFGHTCEEEFSKYHTDCAFLSINAVDADAGYTDFRFAEMGVIHAITQHTKRAIAVLDSSKLGRRSKKKVFGLSSVDLLVMDEVPDQIRKQYENAGAVFA
jgi:DeoR/GlpR family transcriptional regulator of sugar metabolism